MEAIKPLKASFAGAKDYHHHFPQAIAQLTISVGQSVHEGERLKAAVVLINRTFSRCTIMIDDSIQWYTLGINNKEASREALLEQAISAGDHYLKANSPLFESLFTIPYDIIRWKDWLKTPAWQQAVSNMQTLYQQDAMLRAAIDQNVMTFLARYQQRHLNAHYDKAHAWQLCVQYLMEECAVMKELWIELGCHYEVYPSGRNAAMTATYERYIKPHYPHLLKSVGLRFHRKKSRATDPLEEC